MSNWEQPLADFIELIDTPSTYSGDGDEFLRVNAAADAVVFFDLFGTANTWASGLTQTFNDSIVVGDEVASDSLIRLFSATTLQYHVGWDESASAFIISESTADGSSDILRATSTTIDFNASQLNRDFIIQTSVDTQAFVADAGNDTVTIGGNVSTGKFNVVGATFLDGRLSSTPDEITATSDGVAASVSTINTEVTTNGDGDLDNVTLANGVSGQIKHIYSVVSGGGTDSWKITPANMVGGTQITFGTGVAGEGCTLIYANNEGWVVTANNGGTIS